MLRHSSLWVSLICLVSLMCLSACGGGDSSAGREAAADYDVYDGFVKLYWNEKDGRLLFRVDELDTPLMYQSSLPRGVGSNDLGIDRGQLGSTRIVRFVRSGPKVLLVADNLAYRAISDDADELKAVDESFARSVIWGFEITSESSGSLLIDGTDFFLRDSHELSALLNATEEGAYSVDASRSAIYLPRTKAFPDNSEVEAIVTYVGQPTGAHLPSVVPDPTAITVHLHHSFIRLPDDDYEPLPYDPRAGLIDLSSERAGFFDYASAIGEPLRVNYGRRHRLEKRNPEADVSEAVEPIVYYVDRGAQEPVRSALIEGASWWNQAYEAAGYRDAFQVKLLPEDVDPMDVRYNVIQWVHRSTRGWSYGSSILDPRTGEIMKGHVTLGSLRIRQDYMIAEGLLAPYVDDNVPDEMINMALARIRQLSAHEVGHTLGFEHNFAASTQDRASVMDYPVPLIRFDDNGEIDLSDAYGVGIGAWDKRTVLYAYQDFSEGVDGAAARQEILGKTIADNFAYVADGDSRSPGSAHPDGNLWDNGADAVAELEHLMAVREYALARFSERVIRPGRSIGTIEEVLVPIYLLHRFQLHAVGKAIGGVYFDYAMRGDGQDEPVAVSETRQRQAINALLATLQADVLRLPDGLAESIPPRTPGNPKSREAFTGATGITFDPLAPAASATALTLEVLLHPERAARMSRSGAPAFTDLVNGLLAATWDASASAENAGLQRQTRMLVLDGLLRLAVNEEADNAVRATALAAVDRLHGRTQRLVSSDADELAFLRLAGLKIDRVLDDPAIIETVPTVTVPPGSPIGAAAALSELG
jgi:Met-zincin/Domain of unknown function (DUF5117)